jgi:hypothetical protein
MAINLKTSYPGKITEDANNPNGTFKNRTSDALKDGTPYEKKWASDLWGFVSHILKKAGISPNGAEENETNSQYYDALESLMGRRAVDFETKDLITNFISVTQGRAAFSRASFLNSSYIPKYLDNKVLTWDITVPGVLEPGTSEKNSTYYGAWADSDENLVLAPDLEGTTTGTTAGKLIDAGATFLTDLVHADDILYNLTTKQQTTASTDATLNGEISCIDDIFTSGDQYKVVKMSPVGVGENRERLCTFYNNSSGDFDDSYYTQIPEERTYDGDGSDYDITGPNWTTGVSFASIRQANDWTGRGSWKGEHVTNGAVTGSPITVQLTMTGVSFLTLTPFTSYTNNGSTVGTLSSSGSNTFDVHELGGGALLNIRLAATMFFTKKPTFAI